MPLRNYQLPIQRRVFDAYKNNRNLLLNVFCGAGKTPIVCDSITKLGVSTAVILCPKKIKDTWAERLVEWGSCSYDDIFICRTMADKIPATARFVISNYELMRSTNKIRNQNKRKKNLLFRQLYARDWNMLVLDECHKLKSRGSTITYSVLKRNGFPLHNKCKFVIGLSGTLFDRHSDLFSLAKALAPDLLGEYTDFEKFGYEFCAGYTDQYQREIFTGSSNPDKLADMLESFIVTLEAEDVGDEMPTIVENEIVFENVGKLSAHIDTDYAATVYKAVGLAKMKFVVEYLKERYEPGEKFMVCAHHRDVLEFMKTELASYTPALIYGGLNDDEVQAELDKFIHGDSQCMLINERAAGEGIDGLQAVCNQVVLCENDWTESMRVQVIGRVFRFGQKNKTVYVTSFRARKTYDTTVIGSQNYKRRNIEKLFDNINSRRVNQMDLNQVAESLCDSFKRIADNLSVLATHVQVVGTGNGIDVKAPPDKVADKPKADKPADKPADKKAADKKADKEPAEKQVSEEDVRQGAAKLMAEAQTAGATKAESEEFVMAINKEHGATPNDKGRHLISTVPSGNYADLLAAYKAAKYEKAEAEEV